MVKESCISDLPVQIELVEVGLRDGLQIVQEFVPTDRKIELVNACCTCTSNLYSIIWKYKFI